MRAGRVGAVLALVAFGCSELPTNLDEGPLAAPDHQAFSLTQYTETCETIHFDGFDHGIQVTQVTVLGLPLDVSAVAFADVGFGQNNSAAARAFDTDGLADANMMEDVDLEWRTEPANPFGAAACPGCNVLGRLLVIEDHRGFIPWGDNRRGGEVWFSGIPLGGPDLYFIDSFVGVDNDATEPVFELWVNGAAIASTSQLGHGSVETVTGFAETHITDGQFGFRLGLASNLADGKTGSGGLDEIRVCRLTPPPPGDGDEGCTPGYWKQSHHFDSWQGYAPGQTLEEVFDVPDYLGLDNYTLLQALQFGGGSGAVGGAKILLRAAVASLLNASSMDVDFPWTETAVKDAVNAALLGTRSEMLALASELDGDNNLGCPLN